MAALGTTLVGLGGPSSPGLFTSYVAVPPLVAIEQLIKSNENVLRNLVQTKNTAILRLGPHTPARSQRSPPRRRPAPAPPRALAPREGDEWQKAAVALVEGLESGYKALRPAGSRTAA